jgi:hypothetical protein
LALTPATKIETVTAARPSLSSSVLIDKFGIERFILPGIPKEKSGINMNSQSMLNLSRCDII